MMRTIDNNAMKAKYDSVYMECFLTEYEHFILYAAQKTTGKYVTKSDDQWSVSLSAFHEAINSYSIDKGAFLPFAETVIRRRLYDYIKKESKHFCEYPIDSYTGDGNYGEESDEAARIKFEAAAKLSTNQTDDARLEIEAITERLGEYGFSFLDLVSVSPKAEKTKRACATAILYITDNPVIFFDMRKMKKLPLVVLEKKLSVPRKILERHRKYIIAGAEIIAGDYPILSEYLKFVRGESLK